MAAASSPAATAANASPFSASGGCLKNGPSLHSSATSTSSSSAAAAAAGAGAAAPRSQPSIVGSSLEKGTRSTFLAATSTHASQRASRAGTPSSPRRLESVARAGAGKGRTAASLLAASSAAFPSCCSAVAMTTARGCGGGGGSEGERRRGGAEVALRSREADEARAAAAAAADAVVNDSAAAGTPALPPANAPMLALRCTGSDADAADAAPPAAAAAPVLHLALLAATASTSAACAGLPETARATSACLVASLAK